MKPVITFVIPVRHPENSKNWDKLKQNLTQTMQSISAQTNPNWKAVIIANHGADLPLLPGNFECVRVDFPPNTMYEKDGKDRELFFEACRLDKGSRILKGMLNRDTAFFMVVDDDDFIHRDLVAFASQHIDANGWTITDGYLWEDAGSLLYLHHDFSNTCGTSHIIKSELFQLPESFDKSDEDYVKTMLGSHIKIEHILEANGTPLKKLPFVGAIYRIGHVYSHSKSPGLIQYIVRKNQGRNVLRLWSDFLNLRVLNGRIKSQFFGVKD
jgi:glycosyltransferase involved in cell wall biosynthesis